MMGFDRNVAGFSKGSTGWPARKILARLRNFDRYSDRCFDEDGQSMIEMALVLPVFLLVVTGILTFGLAFNNYIELTEGTSAGARVLAVSRSETLDPCAAAAAAVYAAAPQLTHSSLTFSFLFNNVAYSGVTCSSTSNTTGAAGNLIQGGHATVIVTYPCTLKVFGANYAPTCNLQSSMTEYVQ